MKIWKVHTVVAARRDDGTIDYNNQLEMFHDVAPASQKKSQVFAAYLNKWKPAITRYNSGPTVITGVVIRKEEIIEAEDSEEMEGYQLLIPDCFDDEGNLTGGLGI